MTDLNDAGTLGAGIYNEKCKKLKIYEITPLTLGIRTEGDIFYLILIEIVNILN